MKAIVKHIDGTGVEMREVPKPVVGPLDVLVKVRKASICGTDASIYKWTDWAKKNVPIGTIIGHEFVGEIVEIGDDVKEFNIGQRVSGEGHITCGKCRSCLTGKRHLCPQTEGLGYHKDGCFAEYIALPHDNLFAVPDDISDDIAATFDPLGNAAHTALSFDLVGEDILITGAGPIGSMTAAICKQVGARNIVVTDRNDYRLSLAKKMGATRVVNIENEQLTDVMRELKIVDGFTVGLEMSGSPNAFTQMLETAAPGAKIGLLGILPQSTKIDWDLVIFKLLEMKGIWGREIFGTWYKMTHLLQSGLDINPIITHNFAFDDYEKAFEVMLSGQCGKVNLSF